LKPAALDWCRRRDASVNDYGIEEHERRIA
jgi:hypothetical protein